jgi:hypothetical protein
MHYFCATPVLEKVQLFTCTHHQCIHSCYEGQASLGVW